MNIDHSFFEQFIYWTFGINFTWVNDEIATYVGAELENENYEKEQFVFESLAKVEKKSEESKILAGPSGEGIGWMVQTGGIRKAKPSTNAPLLLQPPCQIHRYRLG